MRWMRFLLLGFALVAPCISLALLGSPICLVLAPIFASHLLWLYATLVPKSQWWGPVVTSFATSEQEVWLTLDDGPSPAHTLQLLDLLERFDARATFFVIGRQAEKHPHLITEILARGHQLANHTSTHPVASFWCAGPRMVAREIDQGAAPLRATPERPVRYFRAPAGLKSPFLHPALERRGLRLIGWTVRGLDTALSDAVRVAARIEQQARPGAIILLHEARRVENAPTFSPRCLELTLQRLTERGYRFVIPQPEQLRTRGGGR
ncbi:MAG: polysaccharide deacetylase family protein [Chthoniobacterales bacterium]